MAKQILVKQADVISSFDFKKVDRSKLYGKRRRIPLDPEGKPCTRAQLANDGSVLIRSGMLAQGYFEPDGTWVRQRDLQGMDGAGRPVEKVDSTLGVEQKLDGPVAPEELLDLDVSSIYALEKADVDAALAKSLDAGEIYRFKFNFRADYHADTGYLVANKTGVYCVTGSPAISSWAELGQLVETTFEEETTDDDLDFEMF
jgi:hypothetical protein